MMTRRTTVRFVAAISSAVLAIAATACSPDETAAPPATDAPPTRSSDTDIDTGAGPATDPDTDSSTGTGTDPDAAANGASDNEPDATPDSDPTPGAGGTVGEGPLRCRQVESTTAGNVERTELIEASGVVAGRRQDGVLWAHNDSGQSAGVYGFDLEGNDLGFFELTGPDGPVAAVDVEDIAIHDGRIYLADIGDNQRRRSSITIYVFEEPTPGSDGPAPLLSVIRARYPDGPTDAEAFLVDPITGGLLIMSKDLEDGDAPTRLYSLDLPGGTGGTGGAGDTEAEPVELESVGSLDVGELTARSSVFSINALLFPGSATGADVGADGRLIALRTYGSVWLFARAPGQSLAQALTSEPCEGGTEAEAQGEAVGFLPDRGDGLVRYATVSEGERPAVNVVAVELASG